MPNIICMDCCVAMKPEKNGVHVIEMALTPPKPYKIWEADALKCPGCGKVVLAGFADHAKGVHHEPDFQNLLEKIRDSDTAKEGWLVEWYERVQITWESIPDYGDLFTIADFKEACHKGYFINYDGDGYLASATQMSDESISPSQIKSDGYVVKKEFTHVVWFNK